MAQSVGNQVFCIATVTEAICCLLLSMIRSHKFCLPKLRLLPQLSFSKQFLRCASSRTYDVPVTGTSASEHEIPNFEIPVTTERALDRSVYCSPAKRGSRLAWLETLKSLQVPNSVDCSAPIGMVDLHPDVFAVFPRLDLVHKNLYWQAHYRMVDWRSITTRAELPYRSSRKPWPQKGTGRARHGNRRTHIWLGGAQCKGPRGPESYFSVLPRDVRLAGLLSMLTVRHVQNDLHIVDNFDLSESLELQAKEHIQEALEVASEEDPLDSASRSRAYRWTKTMNETANYVRHLVDTRGWGPSVLFVTDVSPDTLLPLPSPGEHSRLEAFHSPSNDPASSHETNWDSPPSLAIHLACSSYANHIQAEISPEASIYRFESVAPRATHPGRGLTMMPLNGLNVWSMVHHDTIVFSLASLNRLEARLLAAQRTIARREEGIHRSSDVVHPLPGDWLAAVDHEKMEGEWDGELESTTSLRHFTGSSAVGSAYWQRLKYS